jgi:hypothetical protein
LGRRSRGPKPPASPGECITRKAPTRSTTSSTWARRCDTTTTAGLDDDDGPRAADAIERQADGSVTWTPDAKAVVDRELRRAKKAARAKKPARSSK